MYTNHSVTTKAMFEGAFQYAEFKSNKTLWKNHCYNNCMSSHSFLQANSSCKSHQDCPMPWEHIPPDCQLMVSSKSHICTKSK